MVERRERMQQSYGEIEALATGVAAGLRDESVVFGNALTPVYNGFANGLKYDGIMWRGPQDSYITFFKGLRDAASVISEGPVNEVARKIKSTEGVSRDWILISGFLEHDLAHLRPTDLFRDFISELDIFWRRQGAVTLHNEDKVFFDMLTKRSAELASLQALPLEFVGSIARMEQGGKVNTQLIKPFDLMKQIAIRIKTRFAKDDYAITGKDSQNTPSTRNTITISGEDIALNINKSMLFGILYNLAKNAAKANSDNMHEEGSHPLRNRYGFAQAAGKQHHIMLGVEQTEKSIMLHVGDSGKGIGLDESLRGVHTHMARVIDKASPREIKSSEIYRRIAAILGRKQTEYLFAWPSNPHALRELKVGSIFDLRFLAGFSGDTWDVTSLTSGMGLWGVKYITEQLGGTVMGTNNFDKGALFSVILPKEKVLDSS